MDIRSSNLVGWRQARRILCVRLDSLGDVLMTSPALRALKSLPQSPELTLMTSPSGAAIARLVPEIDHVWPAEVAWLKHTPARHNSADEHDLIERLRIANFDACVIFTVLTQNPLPSAMLSYLADIPLRLAHSRENPYQLLTDWVIDRETIDTARHEVVRQLDLVSYVGAIAADQRTGLQLSSAAQDATQDWLDEHQLSPHGQWCVIHPGATASSRIYPIEFYAEVAAQLELLKWRVILTGSRHELPLTNAIMHRCSQAINLTGQLDVEALASLIAHCPLLITGNSGPAHIAAAVGTPVVDLYALTNPQHTPWQVPSRVLNVDVPCRNCLKSICPEGHHNCLRLVPPALVVQAALDLTQECSDRAALRSSLCSR